MRNRVTARWRVGDGDGIDWGAITNCPRVHNVAVLAGGTLAKAAAKIKEARSVWIQRVIRTWPVEAGLEVIEEAGC